MPDLKHEVLAGRWAIGVQPLSGKEKCLLYPHLHSIHYDKNKKEDPFMEKTKSVKEIMEGIKTDTFITQQIPADHVPGLPILQVKDGDVFLTIPYLKYTLTGKAGGMLVYPAQFTVTVALPGAEILCCSDLSLQPGCKESDFSSPCIYQAYAEGLTRPVYQGKCWELFRIYDQVAEAILNGDGDTRQGDRQIRELLQILIGPSLKPVYRSLDPDFYRKYLGDAGTRDTPAGSRKVKYGSVSIDGGIHEMLLEALGLFQEIGYPSCADEIRKIQENAGKELSPVLVIGASDAKKAGFINALTGREAPPDVDTPARTRHILEGQGIELLDMDTLEPGMPEEKRAQAIEAALLKSSGIIIVISAVGALKKDEQLFTAGYPGLKQKGHCMAVVMGMEQIPLKKQNSVIKSIKKGLARIRKDIPVFLSNEPVAGSRKLATGLEMACSTVLEWADSPARQESTESWIITRANTVLSMAAASLENQQEILMADGDGQARIIRQKEKSLLESQASWGKLTEKMKRCRNSCQKLLLEAGEESKESITGRLLQKIPRAGSPAKWWNEEYRRLLEEELAGAGIGREVSERIDEDTRWFNEALKQQFYNCVRLSSRSFDRLQASYTIPGDVSKFRELENLKKLVSFATSSGKHIRDLVGSAHATGILIRIAVEGLSQAEEMLKRKKKDQLRIIRETIKKDVSGITDNMIQESGKYLIYVYNSLIEDARNQWGLWMDVQKEAASHNREAWQGDGLERHSRELEALRIKCGGIITGRNPSLLTDALRNC